MIKHTTKNDKFNLIHFKSAAFLVYDFKNQLFLKTAVLTLLCWFSPQKDALGEGTVVWTKIISRVEELESHQLNLYWIVYLWNRAIGWNLFHKRFVLSLSFCKEPHYAIIFLFIKKCFMCLIDRVLKQCSCR